MWTHAGAAHKQNGVTGRNGCFPVLGRVGQAVTAELGVAVAEGVGVVEAGDVVVGVDAGLRVGAVVGAAVPVDVALADVLGRSEGEALVRLAALAAVPGVDLGRGGRTLLVPGVAAAVALPTTWGTDGGLPAPCAASREPTPSPVPAARPPAAAVTTSARRPGSSMIRTCPPEQAATPGRA